MSRSAPTADDGFTLVELLASLAVLALLSLMLAQALGGRGLIRTGADRNASVGETIEAAQFLLADRLQRSWPVTIFYIRPPGPDFQGLSTSATFLAPPRRADGIGALRRYRLSLDAAGDLVLDSVSDLAIDPDTFSARQVLLHGVQGLDLAYFGPSPRDPTPAWRPDWNEREAMPTLVRVRLTFPEGDHRRWPDLIVRPAATIDAGCRFDVTTGGCLNR